MDHSPSTTPTMFERLLAISREAHRRGRYETAYHALTAAMHSADDDADVEALKLVVGEAQAQIAAIDHDAPGHRLSTPSAARHEHPGVYAMLVRQTAAHVELHENRMLRQPLRAGEAGSQQ
jgi:hypothetical protein